MQIVKVVSAVADVNGDALAGDAVMCNPGKVLGVVIQGGSPMVSVSVIETVFGNSNFILDTATVVEPVMYPHAQATDRMSGGAFLSEAVFPVPVVVFGGKLTISATGLNEGDRVKAMLLIDDR
jgi:hypothetical protein